MEKLSDLTALYEKPLKAPMPDPEDSQDGRVKAIANDIVKIHLGTTQSEMKMTF